MYGAAVLDCFMSEKGFKKENGLVITGLGCKDHCHCALCVSIQAYVHTGDCVIR